MELDISWQVLMDEKFEELRDTIFANSGDKKRFRQLVVNSVIATGKQFTFPLQAHNIISS